MAQQQLPRAETDAQYGFRILYWVVIVAYVLASAIGAVLLLSSTPECERIGSLSSTVKDCTVRHQYMFFTAGSIVSAVLFALVLVALGMALNALARIEQRQID